MTEDVNTENAWEEEEERQAREEVAVELAEDAADADSDLLPEESVEEKVQEEEPVMPIEEQIKADQKKYDERAAGFMKRDKKDLIILIMDQEIEKSEFIRQMNEMHADKRVQNIKITNLETSIKKREKNFAKRLLSYKKKLSKGGR